MNNTKINWNENVSRLVAWDYIGRRRIVYESCDILPGSTVFQIKDRDHSYIGKLKNIVIEDGDPDGKWKAMGKISLELPSNEIVVLACHVSKAPCGFDGPQQYELFIEQKLESLDVLGDYQGKLEKGYAHPNLARLRR